jgi:hypothetical protein
MGRKAALITNVPATPPRRGQITIQTSFGPTQVDAEVWGHLAIHRALGTFPLPLPKPWAVRHVPTGMQIKAFLLKREAVALVATIRKAGLDLDWSRVEDCPRATNEGLRKIRGEGGVSITITVEVR